MRLNTLFDLLTSLFLFGLVCSVEVIENSTKKVESRDFYFEGERIVIAAYFEPIEAFLITPGKVELKDFVRGEYRVLVEPSITYDSSISTLRFKEG